jgi:Arc/MetJ-type ribon-helix-helix transcriptional regulator
MARNWNMAESEKITINMNMVDLGQIDLLVDEGFYSNRTDFIRTAIRNQLNTHSDSVKQTIARRTMGVGVVSYDKAILERYRAAGEHVEIKIVGLLHLSNDITPELARETISAVQVYGVFRASDEVKKALADRTR